MKGVPPEAGNLSASEPADALSFVIPEWVPASVAESATDMWAVLIECRLNRPSVVERIPGYARLRRLVCDARMESVWDELRRTKRDGTAFLNPAWGRQPASYEDQEEGMRWLFNLIAVTTAQGLDVQPSKAAEARRQTLLAQVRSLHGIATDIFFFSHEHSKIIADAAQALEALVQKATPSMLCNTSDELIVTRITADSELRAFVKLTVSACQRCFGSSLYSTVATIANVALDRKDITDAQVRAIVRPSHSAGLALRRPKLSR